MAEYHVGCGAFAIYAGTLNSKNKNLWQNKTECTDEAINAVRDYMVQELLGGFDCLKAVSSGYEQIADALGIGIDEYIGRRVKHDRE